jgi:hypothetical protein
MTMMMKSSSALLLWLLSLSCQCNASSGQSVALRRDASIRDNRFPSVEERIKIYMSNWFSPPCKDYQDGFVRYEFAKELKEWPSLFLRGPQHHPLVNATQVLRIENIVDADMVFYMDHEIILNCANGTFDGSANQRQLHVASRVKFRHNMRMYCHDVRDSVLAAWYHVQWETSESNKVPPTLLQFGDNKESHTYGDVAVPHIKKFRSSSKTPNDLEQVTSQECYSTPRDTLSTIHEVDYRFQPIVWKFATHRHFEKLYQVYRQDTMWESKKDMAIFRGQLTGSRDGYNKTLSDEENCDRLKRCRLVYNHANSSLIYAKLTSTRGRLPDVLNGVELMGKKQDLSSLLEYKGIIMIEGNDVASGLKWALLSQSVVLMPPPKHTSWAMEELLEPWVVSTNEFAQDGCAFIAGFTNIRSLFTALRATRRFCYKRGGGNAMGIGQ